MSEDFDNHIINYVIDQKKDTLRKYLGTEEAIWDYNEMRFTVHDMNRAKIYYLDKTVKNMIELAKKEASSLLDPEWKDNTKYNSIFKTLEDKQSLLTNFL